MLMRFIAVAELYFYGTKRRTENLNQIRALKSFLRHARKPRSPRVVRKKVSSSLCYVTNAKAAQLRHFNVVGPATGCFISLPERLASRCAALSAKYHLAG